MSSWFKSKKLCMIIKPESFLYIERKADDLKIKAVDFGFQLLYVDDYIKK